MFDFTENGYNDLSKIFAKESNHLLKDNYMELPAKVGSGYIKRIHIGSNMHIMIVQCKFKFNFQGKRSLLTENPEYVTFSFRNLLNSPSKVSSHLFPFVQLSTSNMQIGLTLPANADINNIVIAIKIHYLLEMVYYGEGAAILKDLLLNAQPLLFEEFISKEIQGIAKNIFEFTAHEIIPEFYYKIKAEELIYHFLVTLLSRKTQEHYPINEADLKTIYQIRDAIMENLTQPPLINHFAKQANMSESKLTRLFKQIFGQSIYNYHQKMRIHEAANLIKINKWSVSDAGYELGFSNLSHFSRLFERYIGVKPKKYSKEV